MAIAYELASGAYSAHYAAIKSYLVAYQYEKSLNIALVRAKIPSE